MSDLIPVEYQGQRILLTSQLAESYGTETRRISENFNANKERYIEGKHYFLLQGEELKAFGNQYGNSVSVERVSKLYLWTEKGAWLHAKSLNTDKAWEAYEMLVDEYYRIKKNQVNTSIQNLSPQLQLLINMELKQKELEKAITSTKEEIQGIRDVVALSPNSWREDSKNLIVKIAQKLGGNEYIKDIRSESYELLNTRMGVSVEARLTNKRRRMADEGICKSKRDKLNALDVIADDKKLIEGYIAIVKELAIKHGITLQSA
ncbi:ORF6N domain protein [Desulfosporosinus acididurans]|uniref:ORF6N domain protein n=1 Tax=Desulfosporosinus acididurans TaxID=476652 RepID=A0A0J1FTM4_9FIRM|nr:ORF6N domain-containing protein [Desulfosporosinus acididurans]KLU66343.1 ORF6N domain protein [Desulfosporosinus acididurans]